MVMRFDPFRELDRLTHEVWGNSSTRRQNAMPIDAYRQGDTFRVAFDLPGVDPGSVELTVEKNVLTVRAERRWEPGEGVEVLISERPQGTYSRQLFLGETLDTERVAASYDQGVLTVSIPVAEVARPRRVSITQGAAEAGEAGDGGGSDGQAGRAIDATARRSS